MAGCWITQWGVLGYMVGVGLHDGYCLVASWVVLGYMMDTSGLHSGECWVISVGCGLHGGVLGCKVESVGLHGGVLHYIMEC